MGPLHTASFTQKTTQNRKWFQLFTVVNLKRTRGVTLHLHQFDTTRSESVRLAGDVRDKIANTRPTPTARNFARFFFSICKWTLKTRLNFAAGAFTSRLVRARCPFEWNSPRICLGGSGRVKNVTPSNWRKMDDARQWGGRRTGRARRLVETLIRSVRYLRPECWSWVGTELTGMGTNFSSQFRIRK